MMLAKFSVKNYRGFSERIEWDLATPNNYEFNTEVIKDGIIKMGSSMALMVLVKQTLG